MQTCRDGPKRRVVSMRQLVLKFQNSFVLIVAT
jgi:hypothetical protein